MTRLALASTVSKDGWRLRGKFGAPLAAASTKDGAAGAGAHAKTESVYLRSATVVGLECALAHDLLSTIGLQDSVLAKLSQNWPSGRTREALEAGDSPKARSQLIKNTGLTGCGQTVSAQGEIMHMGNTGLAGCPPPRTKVGGLHRRWITL